MSVSKNNSFANVSLDAISKSSVSINISESNKPISKLIEFEYNNIKYSFTETTYCDIVVYIDNSTKYINGTKICNDYNSKHKTGRKDISAFLKNKSTEHLLKEWQICIENNMQNHSQEFLYVVKDSENILYYSLNEGIPDEFKFLRGTYCHPDFIHIVAEWVDVNYAYKVSKLMQSINTFSHETNTSFENNLQNLITNLKQGILTIKHTQTFPAQVCQNKAIGKFGEDQIYDYLVKYIPSIEKVANQPYSYDLYDPVTKIRFEVKTAENVTPNMIKHIKEIYNPFTTNLVVLISCIDEIDFKIYFNPNILTIHISELTPSVINCIINSEWLNQYYHERKQVQEDLYLAIENFKQASLKLCSQTNIVPLTHESLNTNIQNISSEITHTLTNSELDTSKITDTSLNTALEKTVSKQAKPKQKLSSNTSLQNLPDEQMQSLISTVKQAISEQTEAKAQEAATNFIKDYSAYNPKFHTKKQKHFFSTGLNAHHINDDFKNYCKECYKTTFDSNIMYNKAHESCLEFFKLDNSNNPSNYSFFQLKSTLPEELEFVNNFIAENRASMNKSVSDNYDIYRKYVLANNHKILLSLNSFSCLLYGSLEAKELYTKTYKKPLETKKSKK